MNEIVVNKIIEIVNENIDKLKITSDQINDDLTQLGMDSITFIRIIVALEEEYGVEIPDEYLSMTELNTILKMACVLSAENV